MATMETMGRIERRAFLLGGLATSASALALAGPFKGVLIRATLDGAELLAPDGGGYGPLVPVRDLSDGVVRLHLPKGFAYRSFTATGEVMDDGVATPGRHDGMTAFPGPDRSVLLVRNHEINGPGSAFGDSGRAYDSMARGGTTTLAISGRAEKIRSWVSLNGTQMNCAGGPTPWGSWLTCEETINGPDVGNDFSGGDNSQLRQRHGYVFEVPSSWGPGEHQVAQPIRSAGRFAHEAVAIDPLTGVLYLTEDNFNFPSGFYRYTAPANPLQARALTDGGILEALAITGEANADLSRGRTVGESHAVSWVRIDEPDTTFPPGTSNDEAIQFVGRQGRDKGAAIFSRLEGIFHADRRMYIVSTQGGDAPGSPSGGGFGDGFGQVWAYDLEESRITLIFESPGQEVLDLPDNLTVSPAGSLLLCEDGEVENFLRGVTTDGKLFSFARNSIAGREREEFAGATFSPDGKLLFVNIQASQGLTFAIWGPWRRGPL